MFKKILSFFGICSINDVKQVENKVTLLDSKLDSVCSMIEDSIALQKSQYEFLSSKISEVIADFNNVKEQVSSSTLELKQTFSELFDVKVNVIKKSVQTQISQCEQ